MDLQLKGKTAVVTGSTAGIGLSIAEELAREGARVFVTGRSQPNIDEALKVVGKAGDAEGVVADVGSAEGCAALIRQVPKVDILVNNLGIYEAKPFAEIPDEDWLKLFNVNVMSGVRLSRHYFPQMLAAGWGRVIFIASESGVMTPAEMVHYGMTKSSQLALSRGMAEQTKGTQVTVNAVLPGPTRSEGIIDFLKSVSPQAKDAAEAEAAFFRVHRSSSLLQRLIDPAEIAHLVAYLASPLSAATNGAALRVEGGLLRSIV
ncbi:SDR family oxidoreductase [Gemmata sp. JC717]|uniref:SDR family NAD(P)-dependent oxidoreductase n=1 Tax=Gemmata algarum TaxID=2975278 RepID=UPI0021BB9ADB|nr:SDR family oxidoreductase [Gemmata algarum]MDY3554914.1 SDR family oxidoreductase [Gemmata algarum]